MTRYEELNDVAQQTVDDWVAHRRRTIDFVDRLLNGFLAYLGICNGALAQVLPPGPRDPGTCYTLLTALIPQDDDWWIVCLQVPLVVNNVGQPIQFEVEIQFSIRMESDQAIVRVAEHKQTHTIPIWNETVWEPVYEQAFETAKGKIHQTSKASRMGFF